MLTLTIRKTPTAAIAKPSDSKFIKSKSLSSSILIPLNKGTTANIQRQTPITIFMVNVVLY